MAPGGNAFRRFVNTLGMVLKYTAEVEQVDIRHRSGTRADWTGPPGRIDLWGLGQRPTVARTQAQGRVLFSAAD